MGTSFYVPSFAFYLKQRKNMPLAYQPDRNQLLQTKIIYYNFVEDTMQCWEKMMNFYDVIDGNALIYLAIVHWIFG